MNFCPDCGGAWNAATDRCSACAVTDMELRARTAPTGNARWGIASSVLGSSWDPILQTWQHPPGRAPNPFVLLGSGVSGSMMSLGATADMVRKMLGLPDVEEQKPEPPVERPEPQTYVGYTTGYRSWAVEPCGDADTGEVAWRLCSYSAAGVVWPPRKRMEARCNHNVYWTGGRAQPPHESPDEDCECGIWAVKSAADAPLRAYQRDSLMVIGTVALWGKVHEQQLGWRAQYAYPQELWLRQRHECLAAVLARTYGVRVKIEGKTWIGGEDDGPR